MHIRNNKIKKTKETPQIIWYISIYAQSIWQMSSREKNL